MTIRQMARCLPGRGNPLAIIVGCMTLVLLAGGCGRSGRQSIGFDDITDVSNSPVKGLVTVENSDSFVAEALWKPVEIKWRLAARWSSRHDGETVRFVAKPDVQLICESTGGCVWGLGLGKFGWLYPLGSCYDKMSLECYLTEAVERTLKAEHSHSGHPTEKVTFWATIYYVEDPMSIVDTPTVVGGLLKSDSTPREIHVVSGGRRARFGANGSDPILSPDVGGRIWLGLTVCADGGWWYTMQSATFQGAKLLGRTEAGGPAKRTGRVDMSLGLGSK